MPIVSGGFSCLRTAALGLQSILIYGIIFANLIYKIKKQVDKIVFSMLNSCQDDFRRLMFKLDHYCIDPLVPGT